MAGNQVRLWTAVVLVSTVTLGNYFLFDLPGAVGVGYGATWQHRFHDHGEPYTQTMNGVLYSVYSWPNLLLAMVGGVLVDSFFGVERASVLFTTLVLLGAWVTYVGVEKTSYHLLLLGRVLFGLGGETQIVAQYSFIAEWFEQDAGAGVAYGIIAAVQRIGAGATFWLGPRLAAHFGVGVATLGAVFLAAFSLLTLAGALSFHPRLARSARKHSAGPTPAPAKNVGVVAGVLSAATRPVLLLALANTLVSMALYGFAAIAVGFLEVRDSTHAQGAAGSITTFYVVVVLAAPVLGHVIDLAGRHLLWLTAFTALAAATTLAFANGYLTGTVYCAILAIPQAVVLSAVYPLVPRYVHADHEGFAFGLLVSMQNGGMAVATYANGAIIDWLHPRTQPEVLAAYETLSVIEAGLYALSAVVFAAVSLFPVLPQATGDDGETVPLVATTTTEKRTTEEEDRP